VGGVELLQQVHRLQQRFRTLIGVEGKGVEEGWGKLPEIAIARLEEIEIVIVQGAHDTVGFRGSTAEHGGRNALVDGAAEVRIANGRIEDRPCHFSKQVDLFVHSVGHGLTKVL
jgi:hypothetical protein